MIIKFSQMMVVDFLLKSPLFQFEIAFTDIWIFSDTKGGFGRHTFVLGFFFKKTNSSLLLVSLI